MPSAAAAAEESFNLAALIRSELDRSDLRDPHDLADLITPKIPDTELRPLIGALLPDQIRAVIARQRHAMRRLHLAETTGTTDGSGNASAKWRGISEMTGDPWRHREYVGGEWRFLGELTADDCLVIAGQYAERAKDNSAQAKRWRALGKLLKQAGLERVDQLSIEQVREVLSA